MIPTQHRSLPFKRTANQPSSGHAGIRLRRRPAPQGMFLLDAIVGIMILVAITAGTVGIVNGQRRAAIQAADMRAAVRQAETALTSLQAGQPVPSGVTLRRLDAAAPAGWMWSEATGTSGSRTAPLVGLVPVAGEPR